MPESLPRIAAQLPAETVGTTSAPSYTPDALVAALTAYAVAEQLATKKSTAANAAGVRTLVGLPTFSAAMRTAADTYLDSAQAGTTMSDAAAVATVVFGIVTNTTVPATEIAFSANLTLTQLLTAASTAYMGLTKQPAVPQAFWTTLASTLMSTIPADPPVIARDPGEPGVNA